MLQRQGGPPARQTALHLLLAAAILLWSGLTETALDDPDLDNLPKDHPGNGTFVYFSVLHDPLTGDVRVTAEVFPESTCTTVASCTFSRGEGEDDITVPASEHIFMKPYWNSYQLRECFLWCKLPEKGMQLQNVTVRDTAGKELGSWPVEEVANLPEGKKKGIGICTGPVISDVPTASDWIEYYTELGVAGIHMYAVVAPFLFEKEYASQMKHNIASQSFVRFQKHHLVSWIQYHPASEYSVHYFGQRLMSNDCIFRHRNLYEYIAMPDLDEFLHFPEHRPQHELDLIQVFNRMFAPPADEPDANYATATYHAAMYHVHCYMEEAPVAGPSTYTAAQAERMHMLMRYPTYSGYDVWSNNFTAPNMTLCHGYGECLPKYAVRPLGIDVAGVHHVVREMPGYRWSIEASPDIVFTKHLRCLEGPDGNWNLDRNAPLCSEAEVLRPGGEHQKSGGVPACPGDIVRMVHAKHAADARLPREAAV